MTGFKIWLLILNLVAFMSVLACSTAITDYDKGNWLAVIMFTTIIAVFSIICSMVPVP